MIAKQFANKLEEALRTVPQTGYSESLTALQEVAISLQGVLRNKNAKKKKVPIVQLEPGFPSEIGQQINVVLKIPDHDISDTLFRAYIRHDGELNLDFFGEETVVCENPEKIQSEILGFLTKPEVAARLNLYTDLIRN